jgi:putative ubiquitin-RnfH superfamily antitoxin RatB of RatAB toxin-antitoxin module
MQIEVVYALLGRAVTASYEMGEGALVADALIRAAADPKFSDIDVLALPVGIFGRLASPEQKLRDGDRVELYRPLAEDPKDARRRRVSRSSGS